MQVIYVVSRLEQYECSTDLVYLTSNEEAVKIAEALENARQRRFELHGEDGEVAFFVDAIGLYDSADTFIRENQYLFDTYEDEE